MIVLATSAAPSAPAPPPLREPRFVFGAQRVRTDGYLHGWLFLPRELGAGSKTVTVQLLPSPPLQAWLAQTGQECPRSSAGDGKATFPPDDPLTTTITEESDTLLGVCVLLKGESPSRLAASLQLERNDSRQYVFSETIEPTPPWVLSSFWAGTLAGAVGLAAGILTTLLAKVGEKKVEARAARIQTQREMTALVAKLLSAELKANRTALAQYVARTLGAAPALGVGAHEQLLGNAGALAFLSQPERRLYLDRIERLYDQFRAFNLERIKDTQRDLRGAARKILDALAEAS